MSNAAFDPSRPAVQYDTSWCAVKTAAETAAAVTALVEANRRAVSVSVGDAVIYDDHGDARPAVVTDFDGSRYTIDFEFKGARYSMRAMACELRPNPATS